jgi:hypothetical protein
MSLSYPRKTIALPLKQKAQRINAAYLLSLPASCRWLRSRRLWREISVGSRAERSSGKIS